ncbi:MAG: methyltransferase domain-containing protein [Actinobacteria bacterium]|nr:methyltransferase domain-containing protein [Actinomycetota bacterium]
MEREAYDQLRRLEDTHWFYRAGREQLRRVLDRRGRPASAGWVLDTGCGTGGTSAWLARYGRVVGLDLHPLALRYARERNLSVVRGSVERLPFRSKAFALVASLDVLHHGWVVDPGSALREMARVACPGGQLALRVPAFRALAGAHDRFVHGVRRFTKKGVRGALRASGWAPRWVGYVNAPLAPVALIVRRLRRDAGHGDLARTDRWGGVALVLLRLELWMLPWAGMPWGTSVLVLGVAPGRAADRW